METMTLPIETKRLLLRKYKDGDIEDIVEYSLGADVESETAVGVTAQQQALDDLIDVGPLVWGCRVFQTQIVPAVPMVEEDLAEAVVAGGMIRATPRG